MGFSCLGVLGLIEMKGTKGEVSSLRQASNLRWSCFSSEIPLTMYNSFENSAIHLVEVT